MGQRARIKKSGKSKGVAIRRTSLNSPNNTVTVGNVTVRGGSGRKNSGGGSGTRRRRKRK